MRILVVNDDGIHAEGIYHLAKMAKNLGEVWVVAPDEQCSAMSHRITVHGSIEVKKENDFLDGVKAYCVKGTPADCVKVGIQHVMPRKPDIVFSGINYGYNVGFNILYSGTVGAAMEALLSGIPAIAFSKEMNNNYELVDAHLLSITNDLMNRPITKNEIWNVNIPGCPISEFKGILDERLPSQDSFHLDNYDRVELEGGDFRLNINGIGNTNAELGTDMKAVLDNYISIGKVKNTILI